VTEKTRKGRATERDIALARYYESYPAFVSALWEARGWQKYHKLTKYEYEMLEWVQNGPRMTGVAAPRGFGKTGLISTTFPLWRSYRDPSTMSLAISATRDVSDYIVSTIRADLGRAWFLRHMIPQREASNTTTSRKKARKGDRDSGQEFRVHSASGQGGVIRSRTVRSANTGNRYHDILSDDIDIEENSGEAHRLRLRALIQNMHQMLYPSAGGGEPSRMIFVFTFYGEDPTIYEELAQGEDDVTKLHIRTWPMFAPEPTMKHIGLSPLIVEQMAKRKLRAGDPIFPHRFDQVTVRARAGQGALSFARQNMLQVDVKASHERPLRLSDLIIHSCPRGDREVDLPIVWGETTPSGEDTAIQLQTLDPYLRPLRRAAHVGTRRTPYARVLTYVDPAAEGPDKVGVSTVGVASGYYFVLACAGLDGSGLSEEALRKIVLQARDTRSSLILVESNLAAGIHANAIRSATRRMAVARGERAGDEVFPNGWSAKVEEHRVRGDKDRRIISVMTQVMAEHRLIVDPSVIDVSGASLHRDTLQYQIANIRDTGKSRRGKTSLEEDGMIDSLASAIGYLAQHHARDVSERVYSERDKAEEYFRLAKEAMEKTGRKDWVVNLRKQGRPVVDGQRPDW